MLSRYTSSHFLRTAAQVFAIAALTAAIAPPAHAGLLTDFTFDGDTLGSPPPTTFPGVDPYPQHTVYAIGGFPDSGTLTGTVTVQNVDGMFHAAEMSTDQGGTGSLYVDTQFISTGSYAAVSFDLDVEETPLTGIPQDTPTAPNGQAFVIQAFGNTVSTVDRAFRFVVSPTDANGGVLGLRNSGADSDITVLQNYSNHTVYHVELDLNFNTETLDAFVNSALLADNFPFVAPVYNLEEFFIFQNGVEGATNKVAFDNLITVTSVPEPASLLLFGGGLLGVGAWRRRSASQRGRK